MPGVMARVKREPGETPGQTVLLCAPCNESLQPTTAFSPPTARDDVGRSGGDNRVGASQKTCQIVNIETRDDA